MHFDSVDVCKAPYTPVDTKRLSVNSAVSNIITFPVTDEIYAHSFHDNFTMTGSVGISSSSGSNSSSTGNSSGGIELSGSSLSVTVLDTSLVHLMLIQVSLHACDTLYVLIRRE